MIPCKKNLIFGSRSTGGKEVSILDKNDEIENAEEKLNLSIDQTKTLNAPAGAANTNDSADNVGRDGLHRMAANHNQVKVEKGLHLRSKKTRWCLKEVGNMVSSADTYFGLIL